LAAFNAPPHLFDKFELYGGAESIFYKKIQIGRFVLTIRF